MRAFVFRCPTTGHNVQAFSERTDEDAAGKRLYEGVLCAAYQRLHLVNPVTGKLPSEENEN